MILAASFISKKLIDADATAFVAASGATDFDAINRFVIGMKTLGLYSSMVCWPLRSTQNAGTGSTAYSLGGLGTYNGTLVNGPTWGADGVNFDGTSTYIQNASLSDNAQGTLAAFAFTNNPILAGDGRRLINFNLGIELGATNSSPNIGSEAFYTTTPFDGVGRNVNPSSSISGVRFGAFGVFSNNQSIARYINDGSKLLNSSVATNYTSRQNVTIGGRANQLFWDGSISFATYSTTRFTDTQVSVFYALYKSTLGQGLGLP
jgi:prepilin-type processing-associated H-X9-DG protein